MAGEMTKSRCRGEVAMPWRGRDAMAW
jgi:hypothetical protein